MEDLMGTDPLAFILFTCVMGGWLAYMTGNACAGTWRPLWQVVPYTILLGVADRFFHYALFGGELLSVTGWLIDTAVLMAIGVLAYKATQARKMVAQYPWMYDRAGLLGWRSKG
ncbi:MAG: hypothetical protein LDL26_00570 [Caenispirillum bisanense]|nr:hypothetical protein [Caenispirillum bisanense]MCA1972286.1 hypothetical protein [Caenispirillum sp.]